MILIEFENGTFPLPKQYLSSMYYWAEDDMNSSQFLPEQSDTLLPYLLLICCLFITFITLFLRQKKTKRPKNIVSEINKIVVQKDKIINKEYFREYFGSQGLINNISLAQLKAGNNSEKLKNEIRKLLYSLYRSNKLSKTIYKHLVSII